MGLKAYVEGHTLTPDIQYEEEGLIFFQNLQISIPLYRTELVFDKRHSCLDIQRYKGQWWFQWMFYVQNWIVLPALHNKHPHWHYCIVVGQWSPVLI